MKFITIKSTGWSIIWGVIFGWFIFTSIIILASVYFLNNEKTNEISTVKDRESIKNNLIKDYVTEFINDEISHLRELAQNPEIESFNPTKKIQPQNLINTLTNFEKNRGDYRRATILDVDGQEKIRVDYNGKSTLVNDLKLINAREEFYFKDSTGLKKTDVYVTDIDFSKDENGKIEIPYKPIIKMIAPIYQGEKKVGFLVLDYVIGGIIDSASNLGQVSSGKVTLSDEYGFDLNNRKAETMAISSPDVWKNISKSEDIQQTNNMGLYSSVTIRPYAKVDVASRRLKNGVTWKLISYVPNKTIYSGSKKLSQFILILDIPFLIIISGLTIFLILTIKKRIETEEKNKSLNNVLTIINKILRHDLANIFSTIQYSAEANFLDKDKKEIKEEILNFTKKGISSINEMRQLEGMIATGKNMTKTSLSQILKEIISGYKIKINIEGDAVILADSALKSVFTNIINNAIIHGKTDRLYIKIKEDKKYVQIKISDFGIGIPDEIKNKLFNEGAKFGPTGAHGLGLYIVKQTLLRYGGNIFIEDNLPTGATFVIRLPKIK